MNSILKEKAGKQHNSGVPPCIERFRPAEKGHGESHNWARK